MNTIDTPHGALAPADARLLNEIGPIWGSDINKHRDLVVRAYSPVVAAADNRGIAVERDLPYGPHERQVLDLFIPVLGYQGERHGDVVLFVHGGAFIRGKKSANGHVYDNVCYWFARQGFTAVNVEYRLAQDAPYPGGAEDVAQALDWVVANLEAYGRSVQRIFLIGHSAGGTHVATYVFDPHFEQRSFKNIAGVALLSARLRADVLPGNPNAEGVRAYFGTDPALYEQRSPVTHAERRKDVAVFIAIAEFENPYLDQYGAEFFERACVGRAAKPRFMQMKKHNHTSIVAHFNSGEEHLGREIVEFFDANSSFGAP